MMSNIFQNIFSVRNDENYKIIRFLGFKIKLYNHNSRYNKIEADIKNIIEQQKATSENLTNIWEQISILYNQINGRAYEIDNNFIGLYLRLNELRINDKFDIHEIFDKRIKPLNIEYLGSNTGYIEYLFPNIEGTFDNKADVEKNPNFFYMGGIYPSKEHTTIISQALKNNSPIYIFEDCFLRSIFSHVYDVELKYKKSIGYTIDDITHYIDSSLSSRLERMLNDKNLIITEEQKQRARKCIDKILETHLSKYNNQPIFEPNIGRKGVKKVLVVDQSFGDWSIIKGGGSEEVFKNMLQKAIDENPDADIIVKTHPDTMSGNRGGYYTGLKQQDNIYPMTDPINPISLIKYCDKVYVCTTQLGFEALMCGKEVHTFGIPFYSGWGLTVDEQKLDRRTNIRTIEEVFYIAYIMYSHYVNPDKKCRCEIEEAMDYLLNLRDEYEKSIKI